MKKIRRILIRLINIKFMCLISLNIHFQKRVFATPKDPSYVLWKCFLMSDLFMSDLFMVCYNGLEYTKLPRVLGAFETSFSFFVELSLNSCPKLDKSYNISNVTCHEMRIN